MHKNRVKIVLALTLTVAILICNTVSVFAYEPIMVIGSDEWNPIADTLTPYLYPNGIMIGDNEKEFKKFEELYGETCYFSSDDSLTSLDYVDVSFKSVDYKYDGFYVFEHNNMIYLYNFPSTDFTFCFDLNGRLRIYPWNGGWNNSYESLLTHLDIYVSTYPFTSFKLYKSFSFGSDYESGSWFSYHTARYIFPDYCNVEVYGFSEDDDYIDYNEIVHEADSMPSGQLKIDIQLTTPLKLYSGVARFELTKNQIQYLNIGKYAFVFNNCGFINGYDTRFAYADFKFSFFDSDSNFLNYVTIVSHGFYSAVGFDSEYKDPLPAYKGVVNDYVIRWDNNFIDTVNNDYIVFINFTFVCDDFAAFFPGNIEVADYDSYQNHLEHKELMDDIDVLISGNTGVDRVVIDTSDLDNITVEEESILDKVYGDIDSEINKYLPEGYKDPYEYLNDSISDFSSLNSTFAFIKEFYDRTVEATGMGAVILFVLSFGFATYAIGRRLS